MHLFKFFIPFLYLHSGRYPFKMEKIFVEKYIDYKPFNDSEETRYVATMRNINTNKKSRYILKDFDDTDKKRLILDLIGFDEYVELYIKSNQTYYLTDMGDYCID